MAEGGGTTPQNNPVLAAGIRHHTRPDYTEFGIKIHKLRLTVKLQRRRSTSDHEQHEPTSAGSLGNPASSRRGRSVSRGRRARSSRRSPAVGSESDGLSSVVNLDPCAGSRRPLVLANEGFEDIPTSSSSKARTKKASGTRSANWEFEGFYSPPIRTSTPSSGYSSEAVSRTSSFSGESSGNIYGIPLCGIAAVSSAAARRKSAKISSTDDSAYSEVYSTIEELSELPDPFDEDDQQDVDKTATLKADGKLKMGDANLVNLSKSMSSLQFNKSPNMVHHERTQSSNTLIDVKEDSNVMRSSNTNSTSTLLAGSTSSLQLQQHQQQQQPAPPALPRRPYRRGHSSSSSLEMLPSDIRPPLPPRSSRCRPPARPPYPSSIVRAVNEITQPIMR